MMVPDPASTHRLLGVSDALGVAVVVALEGLCFVSAEGFLDEQPGEPARCATVSFTGPSSGVVCVAVPTSLVPTLFGDLMDGSGGADDGAVADALGELTNIVCGNVLPRIHGKSAAFALSPPRTGLAPSASATATAVIAIPGGWVAASIHPAAS
jgi:hypothetical protein